jgi:hypothetical protein
MDAGPLSSHPTISSNHAVLLAVGLVVVACGGSAASSGTAATHAGGGASSGGASSGGASSGGASSGGASSGGASSGGASSGGASSGGASSGGASSGGASSGGASSGGAGVTAPVPCFGGAGGLVPQAKSCEVDADCEALPTAGCCGPSVIVGIAVSARAYEACYPYPTACPPGLGCASFASTEDGVQVGLAPASFKVSCAAVDGGVKSCRTVSQDSSEGTLWSCRCSTGASCCQPAGGAGSP